jgi:ubiquinone/menaquinone biosynthesis C-methylase UbiE
MDKNKFAAIAHTELKYVSPLRSVMVEEVTELLHLEPGKRIIDVGCAKAEILIRMADMCQLVAVGVDTTPQFLKTAQEEIASRVPAADITLFETPIKEYKVEPESFDGAMCVNSSNLYDDDFETAMAEITKLAVPGGMVLMGDYYWRTEPDKRIQSVKTQLDYQSAIQAGIKQGLIPLYTTVCTQIDLDRYTWLQSYSVEQYAFDNPDDSDVPALLERNRQLRDEYINYGRDALGFGLFLFRKPR